MKTTALAWLSVLAGSALAQPLFAQQAAQDTPSRTDQSLVALAKPASNPNRFGLSYRMGLNISADFKGSGLTLPPAIRPLDRNYHDGYVREDISGNVGNRTWNWGFDDGATQIVGPAGAQNLLMHTVTAPGGGVSKDNDDDPQHGFELSYGRELGKIGQCSWGFELAFGYTDVQISDDRAVRGNANVTTETYPLNANILGNSHYGTFEGPGPFLQDTPVGAPAVAAVAGTLTGRRQIDADLYGFKLGPFLDIPLSQRSVFSLSGGLAWAVIDSEFLFSETITAPGVRPLNTRGSDRSDNVMFGGYVGGRLSVDLGHGLSAFTGAEYLNLGRFSQRSGGKTAELDLGKSVFIALGLGYRF